jgi:DEAD/DEAH box helicase domain-containing protein
MFDKLVKQADLGSLAGDDQWEEWYRVTAPEVLARINSAAQLVDKHMSPRWPLWMLERSTKEWLQLVRWAIMGYKLAKKRKANWRASDKVPRNRKTLFFDLETQRSASEVGGWHNADKMGMSFGCVYELEQDELRIYGPRDSKYLVDDLLSAETVVGFNHIGFDYKVLAPFLKEDQSFRSVRNFDVLLDAKAYLYRRPSLESLAAPTNGIGKSADGLAALAWWASGNMQDLLEYLIQDVRALFDLYVNGCERGTCKYKPPSAKTDAAIIEVPTAHWPTLVQRTSYVGQQTMDGFTICPFDKKKRYPLGTPLEEER